MTRISWDDYFLAVMDATALRASCDRGKSACVIVKDNRILATGYVGAPSGIPSCDEVGHQLIKRCEILDNEWEDSLYQFTHKKLDFINSANFTTHCIRTIHAEQNAIVNCARNGVSTLGATLYCTMQPCITCMMMIIQAGIIKIICKHPYQKGQKSVEMANQAGIELITLNKELLY